MFKQLVFISLVLSISANVYASKEADYYDFLGYFLEKLPKDHKHHKNLYECWASARFPDDWNQIGKDAFKKRDLIKKAKNDYPKIMSNRDYSGVYTMSGTNLYISEYDFDTGSFPVNIVGFRERQSRIINSNKSHTGGDYYIGGFPGYNCLPKIKMQFNNTNLTKVREQLAIKIPEREARKVDMSRGGIVYTKMHYIMGDIVASHPYVLSELVQVDYFHDEALTRPIYTVKLSSSKSKNSSTKKSSSKNAGEYVATRDEIKRIQSRLNKLGFDAGVADGIWGKGTAWAFTKWQIAVGEKKTGYLTETGYRSLLK